MKKLGKRVKRNIEIPNEEQRALLPSNRDTSRCSSLGFGNQEPAAEILVEILSELIVEVFFYESNQNRG
ncbi:MAG TPA: hypothetical protein VK668_20310 [Mucilaginibacter sp.]|nr:hypothetical protein [Mucilaginibacter sp.]